MPTRPIDKRSWIKQLNSWIESRKKDLKRKITDSISSGINVDTVPARASKFWCNRKRTNIGLRWTSRNYQNHKYHSWVTRDHRVKITISQLQKNDQMIKFDDYEMTKWLNKLLEDIGNLPYWSSTFVWFLLQIRNQCIHHYVASNLVTQVFVMIGLIYFNKL